MRYRIFAVALGMMAGVAMIAGCEEEISREEQVEVKKDGTVVREKEVVTEEADGTIKKEQSKEVDRPGDR